MSKNSVVIIKNFLNKDLFKNLQKLILESEFPWFQRKQMVANKNDDLGYFSHSFFNKDKINCVYFNTHILPILSKLNVKKIIEVRANLSPSCFYKNKNSAFHIDNNLKCKTAILYLNDCDGGTELKIDNSIKFVKAEENKMLIFDSDIQHSGTVSKNVDFRYIINFNYFER